MQLNFGVVPFSYAGSYLAFSYPQDEADGYEKDLTLRILYGMFTDQANFPIYFIDEKGEKREGNVAATETELILSSGDKKLKVCYQNENTVIIRSNAAAAMTKRRLTGMERIMDHGEGCYEVAGYNDSLVFEMKHGSFISKSTWGDEGTGCRNFEAEFLPDEKGILEIQLSLSDLSYEKPEMCSYEEALEDTRRRYDDFREKFRTGEMKYKKAMEEAAYINWHSIVMPRGYVKYPVLLMTKNKMNQIWSWDYAINALAMVDKDPELAYGQFLAMAECQDSTGYYADCFQARTKVTGFVKPPIQGFILKKMFQINRPGKAVIKDIYHSVAEFTNWWLRYRSKEDGIPRYHHGNDSGWDNSTVFAEGIPVISPDLCAWLIEQMDFLGETAEELGYADEAQQWRSKSSLLLTKMLDTFVYNDRFTAFKEPEHRRMESRSLLLYLPLLLAEKLPEQIRNIMLHDLLEDGKYVTEYGIASEPLDSPAFVEDGYWRGAIWPPTAFIMTEILMRNGKRKAAMRNAERFCDLCTREGFYENYSALDGHGLRDSGFTWTASVFVILLRDYLEKE